MKITDDAILQAQCTKETIAWLHDVWWLNEQGQSVQIDPFYERNEKLTPAVVGDVISKIEGIFLHELKNYRSYHNNAQGVSAGEVLVTPGFDKYPYEQQFAIVQGIDRIFCRFRG